MMEFHVFVHADVIVFVCICVFFGEHHVYMLLLFNVMKKEMLVVVFPC